MHLWRPRKRGWGILKLVKCFSIFVSFFNKRPIFCRWRGMGFIQLVIHCGRHKCMTRKSPKITTSSVIRGAVSSSASNQIYFPQLHLPPLHWRPNQRTCYFQLALSFWWEKNCGLINITSNKTLWARKCNRCSS